MAAYRIGEFVLESKLGEGGMGVVFRARQVALDRWVALKLLAKPATGGSTFVERFHREARAGAQLVHPNIIQIYTIGEHKGAPYYAMEYVEGEDLAHLLELTGPLSYEETVEVARCVTKALTLAGDVGIVHRDIKPANVMVSINGLVKVMDFGLAKAAASDNTLTHEGQIMGTPTYLSPEQGMSKEVDCRSDLYSLGCVLYECMVGHPPFEGDNLASLVFKHLYEPVKAPREINPELPENIEKVCLKLLEKKLEDRFQTGTELLEALAELPSNSAGAELSLGKRVRKIKADKKEAAKRKASEAGARINESGEQPVLQADIEPKISQIAEAPDRKEIESRPTVVRDTTPLPDAPQSAAAEDATRPLSRTARRSSKHRRFEDDDQLAEQEVARKSGLRPAASPGRSGLVPRTAGGSGSRAAIPPVGAKPATEILDVPPPPPPSGTYAKTSDDVPASEISASYDRPSTRSIFRRNAVSTYFQRLKDGRWTYDAKQGHCKYAEGLAAEPLPGADIQVGTLGDCLICANWSRRHGCAVAATQHFEFTSRSKPVDLLEECAAVWCVAGRFDKAIGLMEDYIRSNPQEPEGYRALARLYERPDYHGKDRPRAIILYSRFTELARQRPHFNAVEIERAEARLGQLRSQGAAKEQKDPSSTFSGLLHTFPCFYRFGSGVFFGEGGLSREILLIARAGEVDPDTGVSAAEMGNPLLRATTFIRRIKSDKAKAEEREAVKKELARISNTSIEELIKERGKCARLALREIEKIEYLLDNASEQRQVKLKTPGGLHELIFSSAAEQDAEKCALMLRRLTGK